MRMIDAGDAGTIDLSDLIFSAKIDFVTVHTRGKLPLPKLAGKPKWVRSENYKKLTIHDASPEDVRLLVERMANPSIAELEVAVDITYQQCATAAERSRILDGLVVHLIGKGLAPKTLDEDLKSEFRGVFARRGSAFGLRPFNRVLPPANGQQLHGHRASPVQTKAYGKKMDQRAALTPAAWRARIEVRLSGDGLRFHNLANLSDLMGFRYRKALMPSLRHVRGTRLLRAASCDDAPMLTMLKRKQQEIYDDFWSELGIGAFLPGGRLEEAPVRILSDQVLNGRIGQALLRLEKRMKFVRPAGHGTGN